MKTLAAGAIAGLAVVMVASALIVTGGPLHARKEHRDQIRRSDLTALGRHAQCLARSEKAGPPAVLTALPGCGEVPRQQDPFTGADYGYQVVDTSTLRLCAGFELPLTDDWIRTDYVVSSQPGCLETQIRPDQDDS